MTRRMLIDAGHREETRVVVTDGRDLQEFDVESAVKSQLKGNIYLAKVTRVEPSLQAAFIDYGGNRHGFLAFSEIHPDYFQIPVSDREALAAEQARLVERAQKEDEDEHEDQDDEEAAEAAPGEEAEGDDEIVDADADADPDADEGSEAEAESEEGADGGRRRGRGRGRGRGRRPTKNEDPEERQEAARHAAILKRGYKIQEVIKRRQILLIQVVKEERGNKGAALTTYMSIAGRYCVLMPNTPRGGGISRKIADSAQRRRLKEVANELEVPEGMGLIIRTAGQGRTKAEIKRDFASLLKQWEEIREETLKSSAPSLIYEEANIIKRAIRDLYSKEIDEILVEGEDGYKMAKSYMKLLMPSHASRVQMYKEPTPLFHKHDVERQLDAMHSPIVQLKSGGYIVLNQTEALVAIDVNSGRSTKERNIEETAVKTNIEAAEEVARQLRLRDLAGLIVIDFIDMDEHRNERTVERKLKEAIKLDRARIQIGRISTFGLLEMSRQRLRPSITEALSQTCPLCSGTGHVRTTESTTLHVLRGIENEGLKARAGAIRVLVPTDIALYLLNQKRQALLEVENRYDFTAVIERDDDLIAPDFRIEVIDARERDAETSESIAPPEPVARQEQRQPERKEAAERDRPSADDESEDEDGGRKKRRRRRRRKGRGEGGEDRAEDDAAPANESGSDDEDEDEQNAAPSSGSESGNEDDDGSGRKRRRRGRRGGRRRRGRGEDNAENADAGETGNNEAADGERDQAEEKVSPAPRSAPSRQAVWTDDDGIPDTTPREDDPRPTARRRKDPLTEVEDDLELDLAADPAAAVRREDAARQEKPAVSETPAKAAEPVADTEPEAPAETKPAESKGEEQPEPEPEQPAGPPRRGWWNKIVGN
jgi:ribonuclease E